MRVSLVSVGDSICASKKDFHINTSGERYIHHFSLWKYIGSPLLTAEAFPRRKVTLFSGVIHKFSSEKNSQGWSRRVCRIQKSTLLVSIFGSSGLSYDTQKEEGGIDTTLV